MAAWRARQIRYTEIRVGGDALEHESLSARGDGHFLDSRLWKAAVGGLLGGSAGALLCVLCTLAVQVYLGTDPWLAIKLYAVPWFGAVAMQPGIDVAIGLAGLATALVGGAGLGAVFGILFHWVRPEFAFPIGVLLGLACWCAASFIPWSQPLWWTHAATLVSTGAALIQAMLLGACMGYGVWLFRSMGNR